MTWSMVAGRLASCWISIWVSENCILIHRPISSSKSQLETKHLNNEFMRTSNEQICKWRLINTLSILPFLPEVFCLVWNYCISPQFLTCFEIWITRVTGIFGFGLFVFDLKYVLTLCFGFYNLHWKVSSQFCYCNILFYLAVDYDKSVCFLLYLFVAWEWSNLKFAYLT